jgi:isopentenyl diphosphate isomerase/L-lactate dehydrogenase-like FMN-dependent dehydrogenase
MEADMNNLAALIDGYFAMWNETDVDRRRDLIARTWTEDAAYVDPLMEGAGQAGIDAMVAGVQAQFPGHRFRRTSEIDTHHDCVRFAWELAPEGGAALVRGVDFGVVVGERLRSITGFLDQVPNR